MAELLERVARVGLAGWVGQGEDLWDTPPVLGMIGDELYLVEVEGSTRGRVLLDLIDKYSADDPDLRIDIVLFGEAGGFFASSMNFFELWPKSPADIPAEVFVDHRYKAAFTKSGDEIVMSVRHALRPSDGPPKRRFRFGPNTYEQVISDLARESRRLRDDLIALAQERASQKVASLQAAFERWPA